MLGGDAGFAARLVARIRVKEGLSYSVGSSLEVNSLDRAGDWVALAQYAPQNRDKVEAAFKDEMTKLSIEGFLPDELAAAKSGYRQSQQLARAGDSRLAAMLAEGMHIRRTLAWDAAIDRKVQMLTQNDVQAVITKYLDVLRMTIVHAGDFAKTVK